MERTRWEYRIAIVYAVEELNGLGEDGWELVSSSAHNLKNEHPTAQGFYYRCVLKRPLDDVLMKGVDEFVQDVSSDLRAFVGRRS